MPRPPPRHVIARGTIVGMQMEGAGGGGKEREGGKACGGGEICPLLPGSGGGALRCGYAIDLSPPVSRGSRLGACSARLVVVSVAPRCRPIPHQAY